MVADRKKERAERRPSGFDERPAARDIKIGRKGAARSRAAAVDLAST
jgi:hypothetical protein